MENLKKEWCKCPICGDLHHSYAKPTDKRQGGVVTLKCSKHSHETRKRNAPAKGQLNLF